MKKYDLFLVWPTDIDHPLYRKFIRDWGELFANRIFIHINNVHASLDLSDFVEKWFIEHSPVKTVFFREELRGGWDWRNQFVNTMLAKSTAECLWFPEQDFFVREPEKFFGIVDKEMDIHKLISFRQTNRWHPACIFARREDIDKTCLDFGAHPEVGFDHFGFVTRDMDKLGPCVDLEDIGLKNKEDWFHHNGMWWNYVLAARGEVPNFDPVNFSAYNKATRECPIEQDPRYIELTYKVDQLLGPQEGEAEIAKFL